MVESDHPRRGPPFQRRREPSSQRRRSARWLRESPRSVHEPLASAVREAEERPPPCFRGCAPERAAVATAIPTADQPSDSTTSSRRPELEGFPGTDRKSVE